MGFGAGVPFSGAFSTQFVFLLFLILILLLVGIN
jgi:hypothetical protein